MLTILISSVAIAQKPKTIKVDGVKFKMIYVNGGALGSYYIGETVVTKGLWDCIMNNNKNIKEDGKTPAVVVTAVSWNECKEFINKLNQKTGLIFRLPTEAEWEHAAIVGNTDRSATYGIYDNGPYFKPSALFNKSASKVEKPNGLGIWYMFGNVWEWCEDWYGQNTSASGSEKVMRGGGYYTTLSYCNSTYRASLPANEKSSDIGFRLAMTYVGKKK